MPEFSGDWRIKHGGCGEMKGMLLNAQRWCKERHSVQRLKQIPFCTHKNWALANIYAHVANLCAYEPSCILVHNGAHVTDGGANQAI